MSDEDQEQAGADEKKGSSKASELSDEGKEKVKQMQAAYDDDRRTAVLPGTDGTITGVAINEWLDDDGNPKFGQDQRQDKEQQKEKEHVD